MFDVIRKDRGIKWSERRDSNPRPLVPQTSALTGLRYAPTAERLCFIREKQIAMQGVTHEE